MNVLILGGGGREHALAWKIARSPLNVNVFCSPGNAGIEADAVCVPVPVNGFAGLVPFCHDHQISLVVIGPEQPLVEGVADLLRAEGFDVFGPSADAARFEGSKVFAKEFMQRHHIPTADFVVFDQLSHALNYISKTHGSWVIKADGLAAGKGVVICHDRSHAEKTLRDIMGKAVFGKAGQRVLIEQYLCGEEGSFLVITDGKRIIPLATAQDHKTVFDHDRGPNTGGMGAYSPTPILEGDMTRIIIDSIVTPTIRGMAEEEISFCGILYVGLMVVKGKPYVLEYNVRFGDPETQSILFRLKSDLVPLLLGAAKGDLGVGEIDLIWHDASAITVILSADGYPGSYEKGFPISGLDTLRNFENVVVFHSGTARKNDLYVTAGGRILGVTALAGTLAEAKRDVYNAIEHISFPGCHYRRDIGLKASNYKEC